MFTASLHQWNKIPRFSRSLNKMKKNADRIFVILFSVILIANGYGIKNISLFLFMLFGLIAFIAIRHSKKGIVFPNGWIEYIVFLIVAGLSLVWSFDAARTLYYLVLFVDAGLIWIIFYNNKKFFSKFFDRLILIFGLVLFALYLYEVVLGRFRFDSLSLYLPSRLLNNHNHMGDLWVLSAIVSLDKIFSKKAKSIYLILVPVALYILYISHSRSAYLSLVAGVIYLAKINNYLVEKKALTALFFVVVIVLFLLAGHNKTLLFSRPYFEQSIKGLLKFPYGIGLGNFGILSLTTLEGSKLLQAYSSYTHNLFLELVSGIGVYSLVFVYWFWVVAKDIFRRSSRSNYLYKALFLALTVNFMFDYTYFIPTMLFLWFAFLGLAQKISKASGKL